MKVTIKLAANQKAIIAALDKLDHQLGSLLEYVEELEDKARAAGNLDQAHQLNECALQIQTCRSNVEGDALEIIDDSPELAQALVKITEANKGIDAAIKQAADLQSTLKQTEQILDLIAQGLEVFGVA